MNYNHLMGTHALSFPRCECMALAGTLGQSVNTGSPWGLGILRLGGPTPPNVDLISLPLASPLGADGLVTADVDVVRVA